MSALIYTVGLKYVLGRVNLDRRNHHGRLLLNEVNQPFHCGRSAPTREGASIPLIQNREALIPQNHPAYPAPLLKLHAGQASWPFSTVVLPPLDQGTLALRLISSVDALWMAAQVVTNHEQAELVLKKSLGISFAQLVENCRQNQAGAQHIPGP